MRRLALALIVAGLLVAAGQVEALLGLTAHTEFGKKKGLVRR